MNPQLYVLSRPQIDTEAVARFLEDHQTSWRRSEDAKPGEDLVEFAGRICYMSFGNQQSPKSNGQYIGHLIDQGHESVLEHVHWSFVLTGITRAFTHQLVRHRVGFSFSQLSQQYHDERDAAFIGSEHLEKYPEVHRLWREATAQSREAYQQMLELLASHQPEFMVETDKREAIRAIRTAARSVLPNATATKIAVTANARSLRHFLDVRGSLVGDLEMRKVSHLLYGMMVEDAPTLIQDFTLETRSDGTPMVFKKGVNGA